MQFFQNLFETEQDDPHMNHTSETATIVSDPSMSAYLFWQSGVQGMDAEDKAIGPAAALRVNPGDKIALETWVRYKHEEQYTSNVPLLVLSQLLGNTFSGTGGLKAIQLRRRQVLLVECLAWVVLVRTEVMQQNRSLI